MAQHVFFANADVTEVDERWMERLRAAAKHAPLGRSRLCLHRQTEDLLHEMVIVFHRDTLVRPHRHLRKSESFHLIEGVLDVIFFDDNGAPTSRVAFGTEKGTRIYRLSAPLWHSVIVRSEYAAIHEVTNGPFDPGEGEFAAWAPEGGAALKKFLNDADAALASRAL